MALKILLNQELTLENDRRQLLGIELTDQYTRFLVNILILVGGLTNQDHT